MKVVIENIVTSPKFSEGNWIEAPLFYVIVPFRKSILTLIPYASLWSPVIMVTVSFWLLCYTKIWYIQLLQFSQHCIVMLANAIISRKVIFKYLKHYTYFLFTPKRWAIYFHRLPSLFHYHCTSTKTRCQGYKLMLLKLHFLIIWTNNNYILTHTHKRPTTKWKNIHCVKVVKIQIRWNWIGCKYISFPLFI
jgi:hypothetical protein